MERERNRSVAQANFMVAGVLYEGRAEVVAAYAHPEQTVFLGRDPANAYDRNAIEIRLPSGFQIGFMPREDAAQFAPLMDSGCLQQAYLTKILDGRRAPIPVVQAYLYDSASTVSGAVSASSIPSKRPAPVLTEKATGRESHAGSETN